MKHRRIVVGFASAVN